MRVPVCVSSHALQCRMAIKPGIKPGWGAASVGWATGK